MNFTKWVQSHHRSILFLMTAFGVAGLVSSLSLPVSLFPQVDFPRVVVSLHAGNRPAERMATEVTTPIEQAIRSVPGVSGVHVMAYRQEDSVPEIIERSGVLGGRVPWYPGRDPQRNSDRLAS